MPKVRTLRLPCKWRPVYVDHGHVRSGDAGSVECGGKTMERLPLALDIETIGQDWESLCPEVQAYLLDRAKTEEKRNEVPNRLGLHPGTGRVITIALWCPDNDRGRVFVEGACTGWGELDAKVKIFRGSETDLLTEFWALVARYAATLITYHGRLFDGRYLMIRSAILGVEPTRNLLPYRYSFKEHCDLAEVLSFWDPRHVTDGNLDFWCRQFGISSPKAEVSGADVARLYASGNLEEIARYCLGDARATAQLYLRLKPIINLFHRERRAVEESEDRETGAAFVDPSEEASEAAAGGTTVLATDPTLDTSC
jgi:3'-5' exonuclease